MTRTTSIIAAGLILIAARVSAQVTMTKDEALHAHFPGMAVERSTAFLTDAERTAIRERARAPVASGVVTYYVARKDGRVVGTAFLESMTIRTMPATIMVVVDPDSSIRAVETLAFYEPPDYRPTDRWLAQFSGRTPSHDLYLKRGIRAIAGATLTSQSLSDAVRRLLTTYTLVVAPRIMP